VVTHNSVNTTLTIFSPCFCAPFKSVCLSGFWPSFPLRSSALESRSQNSYIRQLKARNLRKQGIYNYNTRPDTLLFVHLPTLTTYSSTSIHTGIIIKHIISFRELFFQSPLIYVNNHIAPTANTVPASLPDFPCALGLLDDLISEENTIELPSAKAAYAMH
jgi:hypothetical protein